MDNKSNEIHKNLIPMKINNHMHIVQYKLLYVQQ